MAGRIRLIRSDSLPLPGLGRPEAFIKTIIPALFLLSPQGAYTQVKDQVKEGPENGNFRLWIQTYLGASETGLGYDLGVNAVFKHLMLGARSVTDKEFCLDCLGDEPNIMRQDGILFGPRIERPGWSASILTGVSFVYGRYWIQGIETGIYPTVRYEGVGVPLEVNYMVRDNTWESGFPCS